MGGSKGKAPQRRLRPGRPGSAERESGSASADGAPNWDCRPARVKARKTKPATELEATRGKGTAGGHRKPTEEGIHRCRSAGTETSQETLERQGSSQSREPGESCGERLEKQRLPGKEERTVRRGRRRRGKERGPSTRRRGHGETPGRDGDTSEGDGGSSCLDSEAREVQDSSSQGGGAPERPTKMEPSDTSSEGAQIIGPGPALVQGKCPGGNHPGSDRQALELQSREGSQGTGPQGVSDGCRTDTDSSPRWVGNGRRPQKIPETSSRNPESQETELGREDAAHGALESDCVGVPRASQSSSDSRTIVDTSDVGAQPKAELQSTKAESAEAPRTQPLQVGEVAGKMQVVAGGSDSGVRERASAGDRGPRDPSPLAALVVLRRLRARPPAGASSQFVGGIRVALKARLQRVARALGLLRWLRLRVEQRRGDEHMASPQEGEERGPEKALEARGGAPGLRRWLALRLASRLVGLRGPQRALPGGIPSPPQALSSSVSADASAIEDPAPDSKFAVVFPRIHSAGKESGSSSGASTESPTGEGRVSSPAGGAEDREEQGTNAERVITSSQPPSFAPSAYNGTPPDENRSEAEPETLEAKTRVHWAQGSMPCEDPGLGADTLLPQLTLEARLRQNSLCKSPRDRWEPEDDAEAALEKDLELSLPRDLEMPPFPGAKTRSLPEGLEDTEDLARLR